MNPEILWKIRQHQIFLRFEANISLISTGYVNVDSQTSLIVTAAEQFEVNYELLRVLSNQTCVYIPIFPPQRGYEEIRLLKSQQLVHVIDN